MGTDDWFQYGSSTDSVWLEGCAQYIDGLEEYEGDIRL
jgi:hypothetical protein